MMEGALWHQKKPSFLSWHSKEMGGGGGWGRACPPPPPPPPAMPLPVILHTTLCSFFTKELIYNWTGCNCKVYDIMFHGAFQWKVGLKIDMFKGTGKECWLVQNYKEKGSSVHQFTNVSVWRIICENFNPNGLILAEDMNEKYKQGFSKRILVFGEALQ